VLLGLQRLVNLRADARGATNENLLRRAYEAAKTKKREVAAAAEAEKAALWKIQTRTRGEERWRLRKAEM
jgi:hypothetical protein